jgi:ABC-type transport system involved in cytochrome bd biosynthesis fused ATPase/permease subunit
MTATDQKFAVAIAVTMLVVAVLVWWFGRMADEQARREHEDRIEQIRLDARAIVLEQERRKASAAADARRRAESAAEISTLEATRAARHAAIQRRYAVTDAPAGVSTPWLTAWHPTGTTTPTEPTEDTP